MRAFDATYTEMQFYKLGSPIGSSAMTNETPKSRLAYLIDSNWKHSWYWIDENYSWIETAKRNLESELEIANSRLANLKEAEKLLNSIECEEI